MPMIRSTVAIGLVAFSALTNAASAGELISEIWEVPKGHDGYVVALHKRDNQTESVSFKFDFISKDGLRVLATIRGHSVGKLVPLPVGNNCNYAKLYAGFAFTSTDYIICEQNERLVLSNIDAQSPEVMPRHLVLEKITQPLKQ